MASLSMPLRFCVSPARAEDIQQFPWRLGRLKKELGTALQEFGPIILIEGRGPAATVEIGFERQLSDLETLSVNGVIHRELAILELHAWDPDE